MPENSSQLEQEITAAPPGIAVPETAGATSLGATFSPSMAASVRAFSGGTQGLPPGFGTGRVAALQRSAGNQAVSRYVRTPALLIARQPPAGMAPPAPAASPPAPAGPGSSATPGAPAAQPSPRAPTRQDPSSGVDWDSFWSGNAPNVIRTFLEVARLYPGWGLLAGGAADLMNAKQDFTQIQNEDAPEIVAFMAGRHAVAILNSAVGHIIYCVELVQDIATGSVVGVEIDGVTMPLNELLLSIKVGLDGVQFVADFGLTCAAKYRSMKAPPGSDSQKAWDGMVNNYEANLLGDLVGGIFDIIDLSSAGFSNAQPVKQGAKGVKAAFDTAKLVKGLIKSVLQGWFGVWGGNIVGAAPGLASQAAGAVILTELQQMKACYTVGDAIIGAAADHIAQQLLELNQAATIALNGRDPFITARDAAVEGLGQVEHHIAELADMGAMATTAQEKADALKEWASDALGKVDAVVVPHVEIPQAEIGDDAISDAAEGLLNMAGEAAGAGINALIDELNAKVDEVKDMVRAPIEGVRDNAGELGQFMQVVTDEAKAQVESTSARVAQIREKLAKCNSFEDVVNMIIQQIFEMVGLESDFQVDDIRQLWVEVGTTIDEGIAWATNLANGTEAAPPASAAAAAPGGAGDPSGGGGGPGAAHAPDPDAPRGGVSPGAAGAAAASPPSAPPTGAAAGRDLGVGGAAAGAAGAAGAAAAGGVGSAAAGGAAAAGGGVGTAAAGGAAAAAAAGGVGSAAAGAAGGAAAAGGGVGSAAAGAAGAAGAAAAGGVGSAAAGAAAGAAGAAASAGGAAGAAAEGAAGAAASGSSAAGAAAGGAAGAAGQELEHRRDGS
jgi:hypothetical protein